MKQSEEHIRLEEQYAQQAMYLAHQTGDQHILARSLTNLGQVQQVRGDLQAADRHLGESLQISQREGYTDVLAVTRRILSAQAYWQGRFQRECSALINLGFDYLALDQHSRALSYFEPTLDRVEREAFGAHRWRWKIKLFIGLAELSYTTGDYDKAIRHVEEGLKEAQRTSSQKYVALGLALRGKIIAKLGDTDTTGTELQRAFTLADQLQSPSLIYPIAYDLGRWHESTGNEREAAPLYGKAKATIEQMATAVEDEALRTTFLQSALVQEIHERATRLGG